MSGQATGGVWQTAGRQRQSQSSSRTPQNRSGTASPSQQNSSSQPPRQEAARPVQQPVNNVWSKTGGSATGANGQARSDMTGSAEQPFTSVNGFNATEVKRFLGQHVESVETHKPVEPAGTSSVWGSKPGIMANNQHFLTTLAKQIATLEGGG